MFTFQMRDLINKKEFFTLRDALIALKKSNAIDEILLKSQAKALVGNLIEQDKLAEAIPIAEYFG